MIRTLLIFALTTLNFSVGALRIHASIRDSQDFDFSVDSGFVKRLFSGTPNFTSLQLGTNAYDDAHRSLMLKGCGEICDTSITGTPGKFFNTVRKNVDCQALYANEANDGQAQVWPPPEQIPQSFWSDFTSTLSGSVESKEEPGKMLQTWKLSMDYRAVKYSGAESDDVCTVDKIGKKACPHGQCSCSVWTKDLIEQYIEFAKAGTIEGTYGLEVSLAVRRMIQEQRNSVQGKRFFVIGSEYPWLEALLLEAGAKHVTTIEYRRLRSEHPLVSTMTPDEVRKEYLKNPTKLQFDGGATFSSLEHSGLGRYGDTVNPWGDLQAMAKAWCITKEGGPMFVGVPTSPKDHLHWNSHRTYGEQRWPQLMANWEQQEKDIHPSHASKNAGMMHYFTKLPLP